jgi:hypothetical protein
MSHRIKPISFEGWKKEINKEVVLMDFINGKINNSIRSIDLYKGIVIREIVKNCLKIK